MVGAGIWGSLCLSQRGSGLKPGQGARQGRCPQPRRGFSRCQISGCVLVQGRQAGLGPAGCPCPALGAAAPTCPCAALAGEGGESHLRSRLAGGCWPGAGSVRGWQGGSGAEGRELLTLRQQGRRAQRPEGDRELREPRIALASPWAAGSRPGTAKYGPTPGPVVLLYPEGFAILPGAGARLRVEASAVTPPAPAPHVTAGNCLIPGSGESRPALRSAGILTADRTGWGARPPDVWMAA